MRELELSHSNTRSCFWRECACDLWQRCRISRQSAVVTLLVWLSTANLVFSLLTTTATVCRCLTSTVASCSTLLEKAVSLAAMKNTSTRPFGVAVDEAGNLFVCDHGQQACVRVRRLAGLCAVFRPRCAEKLPRQVCFNSRSQVLVSDYTLQSSVDLRPRRQSAAPHRHRKQERRW